MRPYIVCFADDDPARLAAALRLRLASKASIVSAITLRSSSLGSVRPPCSYIESKVLKANRYGTFVSDLCRRYATYGGIGTMTVRPMHIQRSAAPLTP